MLLAADALIMQLVTKCGHCYAHGYEPGFAVTLTNVEHIAAAYAAIQNLLLAATARGIRNYWSSGGVLRLPSVLNNWAYRPSNLVRSHLLISTRDWRRGVGNQQVTRPPHITRALVKMGLSRRASPGSPPELPAGILGPNPNCAANNDGRMD